MSTPMSPIFAYTRTRDYASKTVACQIFAHNDAAAAFITAPIEAVAKDGPYDLTLAEIEALAILLPDDLPAGSMLVPENLVASGIAADFLAAIGNEHFVHHAGDHTSFIVATHHGHVFVQYHASGEVSFRYFDFEHELHGEALTLIWNVDAGEPTILNLDAPPCPLASDAQDLDQSFWGEVNTTLDDPYLMTDDEYLQDTEVHFTKGSEARLAEDTRLIVSTWLATSAPGAGTESAESALVYYCGRNDCDDPAGPIDDSSEGLSQAPAALWKALDLVFQENEFWGQETQYNDGAYDRVSGYCQSGAAITVSIDLDELTSHERIALVGQQVEKARAWLEQRKFPAEQIAEIFEIR